MEYGAHLPLIAFDGATRRLADLRAYAKEAAALGYRFLCANDHLLFARPWLDGPTALAAVVEASSGITLATTVALPVVRGPVQTAKMLAALDVLSEGRLVAGVGPGSSQRDYGAVGIPFEERWTRFDESIQAVRSLLRNDQHRFTGRFYSTEGLTLDPHPITTGGPPIWVASWGSAAGMRRVARLGDGWLASGYNTTPAAYGESLQLLTEQLQAAGRGRGLPNGIATMWLYVTDSRRETDRMIAEVLAPTLGRPIDALRHLPLPIGSAEQCAERITEYAAVGAERIFVWPLGDELRQLELFQERVAPLVAEREPPAVPSKGSGSSATSGR
jgi:alkanesulfonate monooxygenase SsuD/methylene tetrahydromethanopterin reductase-like flavin-dependent oxidoreductase (luciferase family)